MNWHQSIKEADSKLADQTAGVKTYFTLSPTRVSLSKVLFPQIAARIHGICLDAGAGRMAYREILSQAAARVVSMDVKYRSGLDVCGSALQLPCHDQAFDSVFCSQVLEHVPEPELALQEFWRCLKPGGTLLISVPHLAYLHNEPHDYFRYTKHGLRHLCEKHGFDVVEILPAGGLLSFIGHIPSVILKALFFRIPVIGAIALWMNAVYSKTVAWIDARVDSQKIFALNYVVVAKKR